jgi:hypothetical protein
VATACVATDHLRLPSRLASQLTPASQLALNPERT